MMVMSVMDIGCIKCNLPGLTVAVSYFSRKINCKQRYTFNEINPWDTLCQLSVLFLFLFFLH